MVTKTFKRRTSCPSKSNKYWLNYSKKGYNTAISIDKATGNVLPNCVGYVQGRFRELHRDKSVWSNIGTYFAGNANTFYGNASKAGIKAGKTPKLGAIICWNSSSCGHVAIVEKIEAAGDIVTTNSAYNGTKFYEKTITKKSGYKYADGFTLQGFIYPKYTFVDDTTTTTTERSYTTYTVKKGDTLSSIARLYNTTYTALAQYNNISNYNIINVGQVVKIPK